MTDLEITRLCAQAMPNTLNALRITLQNAIDGRITLDRFQIATISECLALTAAQLAASEAKLGSLLATEKGLTPSGQIIADLEAKLAAAEEANHELVLDLAWHKNYALKWEQATTIATNALAEKDAELSEVLIASANVLKQERKAAERELARVRDDAERWRYWRSVWFDIGVNWKPYKAITNAGDIETVEAAIDAARKVPAQKKAGEGP